MKLNQDLVFVFVFELPLFLILFFNYGLHLSLFWISFSGKHSELTTYHATWKARDSIPVADALSPFGHMRELSSLPGVVCLKMPSCYFSSDTILAS